MSDKLVNPEYPSTGQIPNTNKNFAPRVGIAYSFNKSRTVLRAGYGIFYSRYPGGLINTFFTRNGISQPSVNFNGTVRSGSGKRPGVPEQLAVVLYAELFRSCGSGLSGQGLP